MTTFKRAAILTSVLAATLCGAPAARADEVASEARTVDARTVSINLDGVISLNVKQGPAALIVYGDPRYLSKVVVEQQGATLHIGTALRGIHLGKQNLRAELTLPDLRELVSGGVGATDISGFKGDNLRLALNGAGAVQVRSQFRNVNAQLGGVGSMTVDAGASDNVNVHLHGAGSMFISGQSKTLHADLAGVGSLEARQLVADNIDVNLSGLGSATVYAKNTANLTLNGLGSATVYGKPMNRHASARGMGNVSWN